MGNRLAYADTYEQSLAQLVSEVGGNGPEVSVPAQNTQAASASNASATAPPAPQPQAVQAMQTLQQIRDHLARYQSLSAQGKWAEAGKELEEIQKLAKK
jgi:uncharacterized membrane protein (UPF0182 family)